MDVTRREFIKTSAAAATAATVGIPLSQTVRAAAEEAESRTGRSTTPPDAEEPDKGGQ